MTIEGQPYRANFCLAKRGEVYLIFSLNGGPLTVTLAPGSTYDVTQMDPGTGERTELGQVDGGAQTVAVSGIEQVLLLRARSKS